MTSTNATDPLAGLIPPPTEVNDTHKVYSVASVCIVLCIVACLTVLARLGVRLRNGGFGRDDLAIIPATVGLLILYFRNLSSDYCIQLLYVGWTVLAVYMNLNAGVGKPLWEITINEYSLWYKVC
jgi:hypothetical protein